MPLTTKERTIVVPEELLPQLQRWIAEQLRSFADPPVPLATSPGAVELARRARTSDVDDLGDGRKSASNIDATLEKLQLVCEQHLYVTDLDEAFSGPNTDETAEENAWNDALPTDSSEVELKCKETATTKEVAPIPIEQQWQELKKQMFQRCAERVMAWRAEDAAYEAVLRFAEDHGDRARDVAGEWIERAAASAQLNRVLRDTQKAWIEQLAPKPREESPEEKEMNERRRQAFLSAARAHSDARHKERLKGESSGFDTVQHCNAK